VARGRAPARLLAPFVVVSPRVEVLALRVGPVALAGRLVQLVELVELVELVPLLSLLRHSVSRIRLISTPESDRTGDGFDTGSGRSSGL
jgi:hypothetical protein